MNKMQNKVVFITGGSRGIGKAIIEDLSSQNYTIIAPTRKELDLANSQSVSKYLKDNNELKIDILINNAGINTPEFIDILADDNIDSTIKTNLVAPILLIRGLVKNMKKNKWGRIINISSMFGTVARSKQVLYSATKHGLNGVTKALALELGPYNILVNSVSPGFVNTELTLRNSLEKNTALAKEVPLGRFAEPCEIAKLVSFLISENNTYITGADILIDGGFTCQ